MLLSVLYRYNTFVNYLVNLFRYRRLRFGRNVIINKCAQSHFNYGKDVWVAEGVRFDIFNTQVTLDEGANICRNSSLQPGKTGISIGKRTKLQEYARLTGEIEIGDDVIIGPNFFMSSGVHVYNKEPHILVSLQDKRHMTYGEKCIVEDDCYIGMNVCLMPGVKIRRGCIIGAGAVVTRSTEPYSIYGGIPAKKIGTRLALEAKPHLIANSPEDLPYFYRGFDHFNYQNNLNKYQGILTNAPSFAIYIDSASMKGIELEVIALAETPSQLRHNDIIYSLKRGSNHITIDKVEIIDQLINFVSQTQLIIKRVNFVG